MKVREQEMLLWFKLLIIPFPWLEDFLSWPALLLRLQLQPTQMSTCTDVFYPQTGSGTIDSLSKAHFPYLEFVLTVCHDRGPILSIFHTDRTVRWWRLVQGMIYLFVSVCIPCTVCGDRNMMMMEIWPCVRAGSGRTGLLITSHFTTSTASLPGLGYLEINSEHLDTGGKEGGSLDMKIYHDTLNLYTNRRMLSILACLFDLYE